MNKQEWLHIDPFRKQRKVGVMHDPRNGNLMVYYDKEVILADTKVFGTKVYKFFIDEEFCEMVLTKHRNGSFDYKFAYDTKTRTQQNIKHQEEVKKDRQKGLKWAIGVPLVLGVLLLTYIFCRGVYLDNELENNGVDTWATIRVYKKQGSHIYKWYHYFDNGKSNEAVESKQKSSFKLPNMPNGLPLENNYQFRIRYSRKHNFYNEVDYSHPTPETSARIFEQVGIVHKKYNPQLSQTEIVCDLETAYAIQGLDGLSHIYHQKVPSSINKKFNTNSYLRLIRDTPFLNKIKNCRGF